MLTICVWCRICLVEGLKSEGVSHGICKECAKAFLEQKKEDNHEL